MKVLVIYCHPSNKSFTARMKDEFIRGLEDGGHTCQLIDLYQINFDETFSEEEYLREAFYDQALKVPEDVQAHQRLINANDAVVFIYPVFWTEAPENWSGGFNAFGLMVLLMGLRLK